ncbi:MAG: phosphoglucomutase/phosphomannomutase family protein [Candidatus Kapabacteria bacterium]|nr:phosphoglucomutase/phosphomannomutase family protein [Candidatus Kapabacteria bacterium]MBX7154958.1 phosphoglucomutase/phosphomannomutase family protein [Bacteroidota bacterium]
MIVFGTDGWRGVIARDFTFDNLALVAQAVANYVKKIDKKSPSVVIGYDTRFMSRDFAEEAARIIASKGIVVNITDGLSSTPLVSYHTKYKSATIGVVITASHNPPKYNGFKLKGKYGGPATPEIVAAVEAELRKIEAKPTTLKLRSMEDYVKARLIRPFESKESYIKYLRKKIDFDAINKAGFKILFDPMHGAGLGMLSKVLSNVTEIHGEYNPSFGEVDHPEPIAECLGPAIEHMKSGKYDVCVATDGDADRVGMIDNEGNFVDSHRIFMLLLKYLREDKKKRGAVVKTVSLTSMVNKYCERNNLELYETPVGFKYTAKLMTEINVIIGGEESGGLGTMLHIPERDGIFNGLLLLEMMAKRGKSLKQMVDELDEEFGSHRYRRRDVHVTEAQKKTILNACAKRPTRLGKYTVARMDTKDGFKFFTEDGSWLLIRASGTEPLIRFYAESNTMHNVNQLLDAGLALK